MQEERAETGQVSSSDQFVFRSNLEAVDDSGQPVRILHDITYPREAADKPFIAADRTQHNVRAGAVELITNYEGIPAETERALQGFRGEGAGSGGGRPAEGPGPSDVVAGREFDPGTVGSGGPSPSEAGSAGGPGAVPTSIASALSEWPEKIGEQVRQQLEGIQGFVVTVTRQPDGSTRIEGEIRRTPPGVATSEGEPDAASTPEGDAGGGRHQATYQVALDEGRQATVRLGVGAAVGEATQAGGEGASSAVSSGASASVRQTGLGVNNVACVQGLAVSVNVSLINLTVG
jgi:hypothetical protein